MAKKVELKRKWEDSLKDYKDAIVYTRAVLIWNRPIDYGVLLAVVSLVLWAYFSIETTVVSLASLLIVLWAVGSWLLAVTNIRVPWHVLAQDTSNVDHFGDIIGFFVQMRFAVVDTIEELQRFRASNPTRFVLQITASGLVTSYLGSFVSGQFLFVTLIYALLLLPGAVANGVPEQVAVIVEPHIKVYREKIGVLLHGVLQQVEQQMQAKASQQHHQPQPQTQPNNDSPSAVPSENKEAGAKKDD